MRGAPYGFNLFESCLTCTWRGERFFCNLTPKSLKALDAIAYMNVYPPGAVLVSEGQAADLGNIVAPTLVIGGEDDRVFPAEHSGAIASVIPNARLEIIAGTGHGLLIERAARVVELLSA